MKTHVHRALIAGGVALSVGGGIIAASAATLGGLTSNGLGADNTTLTSCDTTGLGIAYTNTYDATGQHFVVAHAVISDIASACSGKTLTVELTGLPSGGQSPSVASSTPLTLTSSASQTVDFATPPSSKDVYGAAIVITG